MERDVADVRVTIKVKHMYAVIITVVGVTAAAVMGWATLKSDMAEAKNDVAEAKKMATALKLEVSEIRCLVQQQTNFQIYGVKPTHNCNE